MKDTTYILLMAIYNALKDVVNCDGVVVPVYDEKMIGGAADALYIVFSTQTERPPEEPVQSVFMTDGAIDIEICHKTGVEVSKRKLSAVADSVYSILFPDYETSGIVEASGFQMHVSFGGSVTQPFFITPTQSIIRKTITINAKIIQQS